MKTKSELILELNGIGTWVADHKGDVDWTAYRNACDKVATGASILARVRVPIGIWGRGYLTLDYAASLLGTNTPVELAAYNLPGNEFRQALD